MTTRLDAFQLGNIPQLVGYMFEGFGVVNEILRGDPDDSLKKAALEHGHGLKTRQPETAKLVMTAEALVENLGAAAPARPSSPDQYRAWAAAIAQAAGTLADDGDYRLGRLVGAAVLQHSLAYLLRALLRVAPGHPALTRRVDEVVRAAQQVRAELDALPGGGDVAALCDPTLADEDQLQATVTALNGKRLEIERSLAA